MIRLLLVLLVASPVAAETGRENTVRRRDSSAPKFWMQRYPIREFSATVTIDVAVNDFDESYLHVKKYIRKFDGKPRSSIDRGPDDKVKYQQFSVVFERKKAERVLARLRRLGKVRRELRREHPQANVPREAETKLAQLEMEREAGRESLRALSSVRAAIDELIAHLRAAVEAHGASKDKVLLNIVIEQPGA